jgi:exopolysaccharide biosynthesis polyprenyl glycosylphosphotransferase
MIPRRFFWILDFAVIAFAFCLAYALWPALHHLLLGMRFDWLPVSLRPYETTGELPPFRVIARMLVVAGIATIFILEAGEAYRPLLRQSRARVVLSSFFAPVGAAGVITLFLFFEKSKDWSRLFLVSFMALGSFALVLFRISLRQYLAQRRAAGFYTKNVLLVGSRTAIRWMENYFAEAVPATEYCIIGYLAVPGDLDEQETGVPLIGQAGELGNVLISHRVDEVIAVQPNGNADWLPDVIESCDSLGILLRVVPQGLLFGKVRTLRTLFPFQLLHLPAIVLAPPHFDSDALFFKRLFDIVVSGLLLFLFSPLFLLIAIAVKLTDRRSDVFYRWNVVGRNGARFTGFKFTTMYPDADDRRNDLLDRNEMTGPVFKIKKDPRITPLGKFLRKFSLNELPQLWSVLKGDMSLVGPRPAFPHELEGYGFWHKRKLSIRPGITCLWQVRGRNKISNFDDWVTMDLEYIDNWSLWLDFKILVRTAWVVVAGTGS